MSTRKKLKYFCYTTTISFFLGITMGFLQNLLYVFTVFGIILIGSNQLVIEKITESSERLPKIYNAMLHILEFCQKDHDNILILVDPVTINLKWLQDLRSTVIVSNRIPPPNNTFYSFAKKIDAYVIIEESITSFPDVVESFTFLWLYVKELTMPVYFLNLETDGCKMSDMVFPVMWLENVSSTYYLCFDIDETIQVSILSPIVLQSPKNWERVIDNDTLDYYIPYIRNYTKKNICEDLYFDRTRYMTGYQSTFAITQRLENFSNYELLNKYNDWTHRSEGIEELKIIDVISKALNTNYRVHVAVDKESDQYKYKTADYHKHDLFRNSSADFFFSGESILKLLNDPNDKGYERIYPISVSEWAIVTRHRGYKSPEEKIRDFYGAWTFLFTFFVISTAFVVILFTEHRGTAFTFFEILRLLISQSLLTRMNTLSLRIFFSMILIYFLIIKATFDGHLAKFLTKPELRKQVDKLIDIEDLGYYRKFPEGFIQECVDYILHNDSTVACVSDHAAFHRILNDRKNIYISKSFGSRYYQFIGNRFGPLINRIRKIPILLNDLGFQKLWIKLTFNKTNVYNDKVAKAKRRKKFQPITLQNLTFSFIILGIGLGGAILSFCIEIYVK